MTPLSGDTLVDAAYMTAKAAHEGQLRLGGDRYITHPMAVEREFLANWGNLQCDQRYSEREWVLEKARGQAISLLHDSQESDATRPFTTDELNALGFRFVTSELALLTKPEDMTYLDYILRLRGMRGMYPLAYYVKLADLAANMATVHMVPDKRRAKTMLTKWQMAQWILRS